MITRPLPRRTLLYGAGAALGLPLLDAMLGSGAKAQLAKAPKRILFYYTGNGFPPDHWRCNVAAEITEAADLTLSHILEPLAPLKEQCLFIEGVPMNSGYDPRQTAIAHAGGTAALFTGSYSPPGDMYGGFGEDGSGFPPHASLDQIIAAEVGQDTRFPAYYMGVHVESPSLLHSVFYAGADQPIVPNADPYAVSDEIFGADFEEARLASEQANSARAAAQTTVLDAVQESAAALRCKLGGDDRARLELHLTQVREIEMSLGAAVGSNAACAAVTPPLGLTPNQDSAYPELGRLQADLMVMALTCDLTRVGGFYYSPALHNPTYTWLGHADGHHNMTHDTALYDLCADVNRWHAGEVLYLAERLAQIPEGDGTMLDNTVIFWASECAQTYMGDPHDLHNVNYTLIGGRGHLRSGRYLKFPGGASYSHNRLLLSLAHYMGLEIDTVGEPEYCSEGPLPHLMA